MTPVVVRSRPTGTGIGGVRAWVPRVVTVSVGCVWLVLAGSKFLLPVQEGPIVDAGLRGPWWAGVVPWLEAVVGGACVVTAATGRRWRVAVVSSAVLALAMAATAVVLGERGMRDCGCFGRMAVASASRRWMVLGTVVVLSARALACRSRSEGAVHG